MKGRRIATSLPRRNVTMQTLSRTSLTELELMPWKVLTHALMNTVIYPKRSLIAGLLREILSQSG
jgi:hypothetical protein